MSVLSFTLGLNQWIIRPADMTALLAYNAADQFANTIDLNVPLGRHFENFVGTLVGGDQVIDHARVRLRGGNSRYAGSDKRHFRFNFSTGTPLTLNLANVRFTKGVDFDFAGSAITSLAPGARVLVVRNATAFASRYVAGQPIAGQWTAGDSLANSGEQVKLSYGAGAAIQDFTYDDAAPWPTQADAGGYSLVLRAPETRPDPAVAANWHASYVTGGSPGTADRQTYAERSSANGTTDPLADDHGDGTLTEVWRCATPASADRYFGRVKTTVP